MLTIRTWMEALGREESLQECPFWPPDIFAVAGGLLKRSGAYLRIFEEDGRSAYLTGIAEAAAAWRRQIDTQRVVTIRRLLGARPAEALKLWRRLAAADATPIQLIRANRPLTECLLRLALIADAASAGLGIDTEGSATPRSDRFLALAYWIKRVKNLRSFCWRIPEDVICVLGKQHTPQRGATFRSLTHHLALYLPNDIEARWVGPYPQTRTEESSRRINLLLLPWPLSIETASFTEVRPKRRKEHPANANYFKFKPDANSSPSSVGRHFQRAIDAARTQVTAIDAVVLPELALTYPQYQLVEQIAIKEQVILICGVGRNGRGTRGDSNHCVLQPAGALEDLPRRGRPRSEVINSLRLTQSKHHRWFLDRDQIVNYQLGGRLSARGCWENIELPERALYFLTLGQMTWSVLICEDLARQDPAAELIRAVGPNLMIALLMDGPQLNTRWAARYASVLAEDPGCSVLSLTSLGMAERSRPVLRATGQRVPPSRVIGLYRDAIGGEVELALDGDHNACLLTLECQRHAEFAADGRSDGGESRYPVFAGYRSFRCD
jgi:hypothetical protein